MKKKYLFIIISILVIIFLFLNKNSISNYYYNYTGEYSKTTDLAGKYNSGTLDYLNENYGNSVESFSGVLFDAKKDLIKNKELIFRTYYNLGNVFYKSYENPKMNLLLFGEKNIEEAIGKITNMLISGNKNLVKIKILEKSIDFYNKAIEIKEDEEAIKNYEFVKEKLRELKFLENQKKKKKEKEEENNKEEESNKEGNKSKGEKNEKDNKEANKKSIKEDKGKKGEEGKKGDKGEEGNKLKKGEEGKKGDKGEEGDKLKKGDNKSENNGLSKESKKALEKQLEKLKKEQSQIGEYYNKNYKENHKNDILESFFNRAGNFDNGLLDKVEKDW